MIGFNSPLSRVCFSDNSTVFIGDFMFEGSTRDWAINEFGGTNLGDKRLTDRLGTYS